MVNGDRISRGHESSTMAWHDIDRNQRAFLHFAVVDVVDVIETHEVHVCAMKREAVLFRDEIDRDEIEGMRNVLLHT